MVTAGIGYLKYEDVEIKMVPGNIYVIPAGLRFSYWCEDGFCKVYFHISILLPNGYDLFESIHRCLCICDDKMVTSIALCWGSDAVKDILFMKAALHDIVYRCVVHMEQDASGAFSDQIVEVMEYIEANLSSSLRAEKIAAALHISIERLRKNFRQEMGIPIGKYIHNRLMNKAELEVRRGAFSVSEISDMLGFCDQFYFSRCFSEKYGMPPTKYRKKVNAKQ